MVVAPRGDPSPLVGSTLRGILEAAPQDEAVGPVNAALHGSKRISEKRRFGTLSAQPVEKWTLLGFTPAGRSIATCRHKFPPGRRVLAAIVAVSRAHQMGKFLRVGGRNPIPTAYRVAELARRRGVELPPWAARRPSTTTSAAAS